jgi:hypothetical protein
MHYYDFNEEACKCGAYWDNVSDECSWVLAQEEDDEELEAFYAEAEDFLSDAEADSMTLASAGWGTDEDYGSFGSDFDY